MRYKKNAFRDCFITYCVAMTNDPKLVAMESGNSERMIRDHYLHLATKCASGGVVLALKTTARVRSKPTLVF